MRRSRALAIVILLVTGCASEEATTVTDGPEVITDGRGPVYDADRFVIDRCKAIWVYDEKSCDSGKPTRYSRMGCALTDRVTGCEVGLLRVPNPQKPYPLFSIDWSKPDFLYARVWDWECPAGSAPPSRQEFPFAQLMGAPVACDDEEAALPERSPLLKRRTLTFRP
jgi:hypothetical protein